MVSTFAKPRDSLRETLLLLPSPQRRSAAPATASAKTGEPGGVRTKKALRVMVREVRPNPSFNRSANGRPPSPGRWYAVHFHRPGLGVLPLSPG